MSSQIRHSARGAPNSEGKRLLIAALALFTVAAVAACVPPSGVVAEARTPPTAITITASSATIAYGDAVPAITPSYAGLPSGQTQTATPPTCATTATSTSPPGTYPTICSGAVDGTSTINYVNGTITIEPAPVDVTASSASMDVGGSVPTITASYSGLKNGDTAPAVLPTCSTTATSSSPAGTYPSTCSGAVRPELHVHLRRRHRRRRHRVVTVTASSGSSHLRRRPLRRSPPATRASCNGDTAPATAPTCSTTATSSSPVGTYASSCSGAADPNYTFVYVDGTVTVDSGRRRRHRLVGHHPVHRHARRRSPPSYSGLVNGDTAPATAPTCSTTATRPARSATYPSTCSGAADPNYTFSYVDGTITVTTGAVPVTVTASSATITYGDSVPADHRRPTPASPAARPTRRPLRPARPTATSSSPAGTYPTTCSGAADPNYDFVYVAGTITITPGCGHGDGLARTRSPTAARSRRSPRRTRAWSTATPLRPRRRPAPRRRRRRARSASYPSSCSARPTRTTPSPRWTARST